MKSILLLPFLGLLVVAAPPGRSVARPAYFRLSAPSQSDVYSISHVNLLADSFGYVVVGYNESSATRRRSIGVVAANRAGKQLWSRTYGVKRLVRELRVLRTGDGGVLVWGNEADATRPLLLRIGAKGESLWSRTYRGSFRPGEYGHPAFAIAQTSDGGFVLAGIVYDPNGKPAYLLKTDARGDTLWVRSYDAGFRLSPHSIQQTADGGYSVTGAYGGSVGVVRLDGDGEVRTDSSGDSLWTRTHGDRLPKGGDWAQQTADGGSVSVGQRNRSTSGIVCPRDVWAQVVRTNAHGDTLWTRSVDGTGNWGRWSIFKTADDGLEIAALDPENPFSGSNAGRPQRVSPDSISIRVISVDPAGKVSRSEYPEDIRDFEEGLAAAAIDAKWGYVDEARKFVIPRRFDDACHFSEGLAAVKVGGRWGFIGKDGGYVIEPKFDAVDEFTGGLASAKTCGKWGYIDRTGSYVVPAKFDQVTYFACPLSQVRIGDTWAYIDRSGEVVFRSGKDDEGFARHGLTTAKLGDKWGYKDSSGAFVIAPQFDWAIEFWYGLAQVKVGGKMGYIDRTGRYIWKEDGGGNRDSH